MNLRILAAYFVLLVCGIPWYWSSGGNSLYFGLPLWVLVSLFVGFLAALLTAWLFLRDTPPDGGTDGS